MAGTSLLFPGAKRVTACQWLRMLLPTRHAHVEDAVWHQQLSGETATI